MPRPWRRPLFTANCCVVEEGTIISNLSRCRRPTRSDLMISGSTGGKALVLQRLPTSSFRRLSSYLSSGASPSSGAGRFTDQQQDQEPAAAGFGAGLHAFQLAELRAITQNFSANFLLGQGGFGTVHKGYVDEKLRHGLPAQPVAVKLLNIEGLQGHREWLAEVIFLGRLRHPNLVKLIGYCCEDEDRLLVYEFMPRGSLENHLFRRSSVLSLSWGTRLKIAVGAAKGLAFLHGADAPVIYRDFKTSNILLDSDFTAKLSDFGLAKMGPEGEETHVTTRVMGTHGHLTTKSDVYSFGVVLLELLTGRRSMDKTRAKSEENIVDWAKPFLSSSRRLRCVMDPKLAGQYSVKGAREVAALALRCVSSNPKDRPKMPAVVEALHGLQHLRDMAVNSGAWPAAPLMAGRRVVVSAKANTDASCRGGGGAPHRRTSVACSAAKLQ